MEIKDVGQRITKLRKEKGWSQIALAEQLNVSDKTVSKWENGGMPGIDLFPKMAKLFNVSIDYLMTGNDDNNPIAKDGGAEIIHPTEVTEDKQKSYVCPKCNNVNYNPGTHCTFCYHEFNLEQWKVHEEVVAEVCDEEPVILYDEATGKPICPKCNRVNPYFDTHCVFCYHDFSKKARTSSVKNNNGKYSGFYNNRTNPNSRGYTSSNTVPNYPRGSASQVGCLAYFIAFLFPLIGLIWGAVKNEKSLIIFSAAIMATEFFAYILYLIFGVLLLADGNAVALVDSMRYII